MFVCASERSLCPIGREAQVLIPDKSPMDNKLLATFKEMGRKDFGEVLEVNPAGLLPHRCVLDFQAMAPRGRFLFLALQPFLGHVIFFPSDSV